MTGRQRFIPPACRSWSVRQVLGIVLIAVGAVFSLVSLLLYPSLALISLYLFFAGILCLSPAKNMRGGSHGKAEKTAFEEFPQRLFSHHSQ